MNVTPHARTACRSTGDRKYGWFVSRRSAAELASMSATLPIGVARPLLIAPVATATGSSLFIRSAQVGAT